MTPSARSIVVVGASVAGVSAADNLRAEGFDGTITVVGDEPYTAYSRPALSKGMLTGDDDADGIRLPALDASIDVRTATRAVALDTDRSIVTVEHDGVREDIPFDGLVIATGARARRLGAGDCAEVVLRDLDDSIALANKLHSSSSMIIVGGGFLALEMASIGCRLGLDVTVVHALPPLTRHVGGDLAGLIVGAARAAGVQFVATPSGARAADGAARGVRLSDGTMVMADMVVTAIGDRPNVEWLAGSGLPTDGPIQIAPGGQVRPGIVAAGDVTITRHAGGHLERTPHWHSAIDQGRAAARSLLGLPPVAAKTPYFWTEGFDIDLKITGRIPIGDRPTVLEGSLPQRDAVLQWRGPDGTPVAAATVNHRMPLVKLSRLARPQLTEVNR